MYYNWQPAPHYLFLSLFFSVIADRRYTFFNGGQNMPKFPEFENIELKDKEVIKKALWEYQPETSDLTFTNLFIWRAHYDVLWTQYKDWLLIVYERAGAGLPPIGPPSREEPTRVFLNHLRTIYGEEARLERADTKLIAELRDNPDFVCEPTRNHFDYIYRSEDLVQLAGRKYDAKRNHLNVFRKNNQFTYRPIITCQDLTGCLEMAHRWCSVRGCDENMDLHDEYLAVINALNYFMELDLTGSLIEINGRIEAFTIGELLNKEMAVIHVEKADSQIRGLYAAINQQFAEHNWSSVKFINREQDLGEPSLRKAKESYYPDHMVEKFRINIKT